MIRSIRTEFLKLRTTRLPWALLGTAAGLTALTSLLIASRAGGHNGHMEIAALNTVKGITQVMTNTGFAMLMALVFGVTISSGEFRHGTATSTYLAAPDRVRVMTAKAITAAGVGLLFGLVGSAITTGVGLAFVAAKGYSVSLGTATIARFAVGAVLGSGLLAAAGVAVGSLIRSQVAAIITVFAWGFVIEQIVGGLFNSVQPYLPYTAATTLAGSPLGGGTSALPFAAAAGLVVGAAALISAVAARTTVQLDVS